MNVLLHVGLQQPSAVARWTLRDWDLCLRQAARCKLTARLALALESAGVLDAVPAQPRRHLHAARVLVDKHRRDVAYEIECIHDALRPLDIPILLLKGGAYVAACLPLAAARLFHDLDIMVPRERLADVESALREAGWMSAPLDAYDQSYYREWTHELPPMMHAFRGTLLDVHHTILPPTATPTPDPEKLLAASRRVRGRLRVLEPVDMFLHSATHLFHEGEFEHGYRDLLDLRDLLAAFRDVDGFARRLGARSRDFGLQRIVHHALAAVRRFWGSQCVPAVDADGAPAQWQGRVMDALFDRALAPIHPSCDDAYSVAARFTLYLRGHWLRMPPRLLVPHLLRKTVKRLRGDAPARA